MILTKGFYYVKDLYGSNQNLPLLTVYCQNLKKVVNSRDIDNGKYRRQYHNCPTCTPINKVEKLFKVENIFLDAHLSTLFMINTQIKKIMFV